MPKVTEAYLEAQRQRVLNAAMTCFTRKGFHKTTMDEICQESRLSPGAVYRYFASKEEIIDAAMQEGSSSDLDGTSEFARWVEAEAASFDDFEELMNTFNNLWYQRFEKGSADVEVEMKLRLRAWAEALDNPAAKTEIVKRWDYRLGLYETIVSRAQELGQINADLDSGAVGRVILAIAEGFRLLWTVDPNFDKGKFEEVEAALYTGNFWCNESGDVNESTQKTNWSK
jgi:AcrR family transcriptional regulator